MRNLKKVLTLVLTLAMLLSVMVVGAGAATFGDQDSITNDEAVDMCVALNIIGGYEDGTFRPAGNVTRAEMSKMICVALNGGKEPNMGSGLIGTFNDVATSDWSAPYVEYCVSQGIVGGVGGGRFNPNGNITGTQAAKMLLCILGYNASIQGYVGNDYWETKINVDAAQKGLYEGLADIDASAALTRDQAAQMIWNALQAYEVEYVTTLVTGPNGELTSKVTVQDKVSDDTLRAKIALVEDKYDANIEYGYMTAIDYESVKGEYTYNFDADANFGGVAVADDPYTGTLTTTKDFTDLFGQKVAVVYKDNNDKTVYGMYAESSVLASDIVGNITNANGGTVAGTDTQIKIGDAKFRLDGETMSATSAYVYNDATSRSLPGAGYYSIDAIDHDGDNKIDCFVYYPVSPAKVTYVGTSSINAGNNSYSYDKDDKVYSNGGYDYDFPTVSKDEWVAIDQYNVTAMARKVATLDKVQGEITAMKGTDVQINGTWYELVASADDGDTPVVGDTVALAVIGGYYFHLETIDGKSLDNVLMVLAAGNNSSGLGSGVEAKVMYAKDGTVATISKISKVNNTNATVPMDSGDPTTPDANPSAVTHYDTNGNVVVGALYTYKEKDGAVELTRLADGVIGDSKFVKSATTFVDHDTASTVDATVDNKPIANDAVVMVYDKASDKYSFTTGSVLKTWSSSFGDTVQYLYETINGVPTVTAVALYANSTSIPGVSGTTGYGYVTTAAYYTKIDDTDYAVLTIWTADGELKDVKAESIYDDSSACVDPSDANVKLYDAAKKGAFVSFEKLANGNISELTPVGTAYALTGTYINRDNETELTLSNNATSITMTATKDTQIVYVNTEDVTGGTGTGNLADSLAIETATDNVYILNVMVAGTNGADADYIFVDVNKKLDGVGITLAAPTGAELTGALSSDNVTVSTTLPSSNVSIPAGKTLTLGAAQAVADIQAIAADKGAKLVLNAASTGNYDTSSGTKFYSGVDTELTAAPIPTGIYEYKDAGSASGDQLGWVKIAELPV